MMALWSTSDSFACGKRSRLEAILSNSEQVSLNDADLSAATYNPPLGNFWRDSTKPLSQTASQAIFTAVVA
jgi:hypothetical protein